MKKLQTTFIFMLTLVFFTWLTSCSGPSQDEKDEDIYSSGAIEKYEVNYEILNDTYVTISTVRDCEYVFWHKGRGSDMEHYEGCTNPKHCN